MHPGTRIFLTLTDISYLGGAVGHIEDNFAVFARGGLPGERVSVEIEEVRPRFARGVVVAVDEPAPERVTPPCPYFGACGGCQWQHLAYAAQLRWKEEILRRQLSHIGHLPELPIRPVIAAAEPYAYRNHARFSVEPDGSLSFARFQSNERLPIEACLIMQPAIVDVMKQLRGLSLPAGPLTIRYGSRTGQLLIAPKLPSGVGEPISGQSAYEEILGGRRYRVSAGSFFQVNTRLDQRELPEAIRDTGGTERRGFFSQVDLLALLVLDRLNLQASDFVVDAYCGVGTFSLLIAERVRRVVGIEESPTAIRDARHNAQDVDNVEFVEGRAESQLIGLAERPRAVVLDPSRSGCDRRVLQALISLRPEMVVYVSCDPATLARDLAFLTQHGFEVEDIQPIDLFPQTHHIEAVTVLRSTGVD
ncbi:MAG TPA: class I SAM-dependent RNA methyltransferase [Chloroflexota bacterium]|nr:class I SAM-dependent RNA methyltransferase [Chloroflexota bacterium]